MMNAERVFDGRLIFDHLPKTAGQAINAWLVERLGSGCVTGNLNGVHRALIRKYGGQYSVISGHITYRGCGLDPRYRYITLLRDPVDRAISWLFFIVKNHERQQAGKLWPAADRFLRSEGDDLGNVLAASLVNPYTKHFSEVSRLGELSDETRLELALGAIAQYDITGFYEQMPQFLSSVAMFIGVDAPPRIERVNTTLARPSVERISTKLRDRLKELVALDLEIYKVLRSRADSRDDTKVQRVNSAPVWKTYVVQDDWTGQWAAAGFGLISVSLQGAKKVVQGDLLEIAVDFALAESLSQLVIGIHIVDEHERRAFGTNNDMLGKPLKQVRPGIHRANYFISSDLPEGEYAVALNFVERTAQGDRALGWFPRSLDFKVAARRPSPSVGYAGLPASMSYRRVSIESMEQVSDARGTLVMLDAVREMGAGEVVRLGARIENTSNQSWISSHFAPIGLSCRWLDQAGAECHVDDGRNALPVAELLSGSAAELRVVVSAPSVPGVYQLMLVPVQTQGRTFDQFGFSPAMLSISVLPAGSVRSYDGGDVRFLTECGRRDGSAMCGTGQAGFLLFGPYVTLTAGRYTVRIHGQFNDLSGSAWADVCHTQGTIVLARRAYSELKGGQSFEMAFSLADEAREVEFRLWVPEGADSRVDTIEFEAAHEAEQFSPEAAEYPSLIEELDQDFSGPEPIREGRGTESPNID
jgi:hypothetical protein